MRARKLPPEPAAQARVALARAAGSSAGSGLLLLAVVAALGADLRTNPETRGRVTTWLDVTIAKPNEQGSAEVTLVVSVEGPRGLEAKTAIDDARWTTTFAPSTLGRGDPVVWTQTIALKQKNPGQVPLPAVKVSFRDGPDAAWETVEWSDLLSQVRGQPTPIDVPEPPATPNRWRAWTAGLLSVVVVLLVVGWMLRRPRKRAVPLAPEQRAARDLDAAAALMATDVIAAHERLADTVRGFLAERFGLPGPRQTTAEFLEAIAREASSPGELREFLERCDLVKFAGVRPTPEENRRTLEMARQIIKFSGTGVPPVSRTGGTPVPLA